MSGPCNMKEEWDRVLTVVAATGLGGFIVGVFRIAILRKYGGWLTWLAALCGSVLVAVLAGLAVQDTGLTEAQRWGVVGICAFVADDLVIAIMSIAQMMRSDPVGFFSRIVRAARGKDIGRRKEDE